MIRLKLSPELSDGEHWTVVDTPEALFDAIRVWWDEMKDQPGEGFQVETVDMSDAEVAALPSI